MASSRDRSPVFVLLFSFVSLFGLALLCSSLAAQDAGSTEDELSGITIDGQAKGPAATDDASRQIIETNLKWRGGEEALRKIRTLEISGAIREGLNDYKVTWYRKAPDMLRIERRREHLGWVYLTVIATDGESAWMQEISPEKKPPAPLGKREAEELALEADFYGPLVDWEEKGHRFQYMGPATVSGSKTYLVKGFLKDGSIYYFYFDSRQPFLRNVGMKEVLAGKKVDVDRFPLKITTVDGVRMETAFEYRSDGDRYRLITYDSIRANVPLDDELFVMPKAREVWLRQR